MPAGIAEYETTGTRMIDLATCIPQPGVLWGIELREEVTQGGIVLPDTGDAQALRIGVCVTAGAGEVNERGDEKRRFVKDGEYFMFGRHQSGGEPFTLNGCKLLLFRQNDIAGKITKPEPWMVELGTKRLAKLHGVAAEGPQE